MGEAFGVVASALAVVELSAKVVKLCTTYTRGVLNASSEINRMTSAAEGVGRLAKRIKDLKHENPQKLPTLEGSQHLLDDCQQILEKLKEMLEPGKGRTILKKLHLQALGWPFKSKEAETMMANLNRLTHNLDVAIQVDQTHILLDMTKRQVLDKLPLAGGATYDSHEDEHTPRCLPETRIEVFETISQWARDPSSRPIFWLNGMAGTGKSTISRTLAGKSANEESLGATFFFKRGGGDRAGMSKLFSTISSQLVQRIPSMARYVQDALENDKSILARGLQEQFDKLIQIPIASVSSNCSTQPPLLIILDALDECDRMEDIKRLLELLSSYRQCGNIRLKFFLTSRPEIPAREGFKQIDGGHQNLILHDVAEDVIEQDIAAFFQHELTRIRNRLNQNTPGPALSESWPAEDDMVTLIQMAVPLFIFAATVCRFIDQEKVSGPDDRLKIVLDYRTKSRESTLGATYLPVLDQMTIGLGSTDQAFVEERFRNVVGPIITLASPLPTSSLARLIEVAETEIDNTVRSLHSVLNIPSSWDQPICMFHSSFRDFLVDPKLERKELRIDEKAVHHQLALRCFEILDNSLTTDICQVRDWRTAREDLSPHQIDAHLSPELQYACLYWVFHLQESAMGHSMVTNVEHFCSKHFLQWLEALSWIDEKQKSVIMVDTLRSIFTTEINQEMSKSLNFLRMLVDQAGHIVNSKPLEVYNLTPMFSSIGTIFRDIHQRDWSHWPFLRPNGHILSRECQEMLEDHTILIIAFSLDGKLMATGSSDHTVTLWMAETGEQLHTLRSHSDAVKSIAFSPNGRLIATASADNTVILWTTKAGQHLQTLTSHTTSIDAIAVAFSPNSQFLVSASNAQLRVWTANDSGQWQTMWNHGSLDGDSSGKSRRSTQNINLNGWVRPSGKVSTMKIEDDEGKRFSSHGPNSMFMSGSHSTASICTPSSSDEHPARIASIVLRPNGQLATSVSTDSAVVLWAGDMNGRHQSYDNSARLALTAFSPDNEEFSFMFR